MCKLGGYEGSTYHVGMLGVPRLAAAVVRPAHGIVHLHAGDPWVTSSTKHGIFKHRNGLYATSTLCASVTDPRVIPDPP